MGNRYGEAIQKDGFFSIYADEDSYQAQNLRFSNPEGAPLGTFIAESSPGDSNNWPTSGKKGFYQAWRFTRLE
jgi:hypothetical protein